MNYKITAGFSKLIFHRGPKLHEWQKDFIGKLYSTFYCNHGWHITLSEGEILKWQTGQLIPFNDSGDVLIIIPMAFGLGDNGYMTSGEFVLSLDETEIIDFNVTKYSKLWKNEKVRFYYEVKKKRTEPETMTAGLGYLLIPGEMIGPNQEHVNLTISNRKKAIHEY